MKYWEIIADNSAKPVGVGVCLSRGFQGANIWIADAHRDDGKRFVVHADEKLTAFIGTRICDSRERRIALTSSQDFLQTRVAKRILGLYLASS